METRTDSPLTVLLSHKWLILAITLLAAGAAYGISTRLDEVYSTEAKLLVAPPAENESFDSVQAGQAVARSYVEIIDSPNIAVDVADEIGGGIDASEVAGATSFESIPETQLLSITAEAATPEGAQEIADTYAEVFTDYSNTNLRQTTKADVELADSAPLPASPARPKPVLYTIVAGFLGLAAALALAFALNRIDRRLRTADEVERRFGLPLLARVPLRRRSKASATAFAEAHQLLRTNLEFARGNGTLESVAAVSEKAGEGKTTTVANLAVAVAETGRKVIAVEADFRRPALTAALMGKGAAPLQPGLSNYLAGAAQLQEILHPTGHAGLSLVPSGPLPPTPSALLESDRGYDLLRQLKQQADVIVIDCPPLSVGADASVVSTWVDGVMLVVDLRSSTDHSVRNALRQLEAIQATVAGILINRDRGMDTATYRYYRAGGGSEPLGPPRPEPAATGADANGQPGGERAATGRRVGSSER
jgi:capsular exopolysaccharide synthesis family protein